MGSNLKMAVVGLGYVCLPLARLFATKPVAVGFDINEDRVACLQAGTDSTLEVDNVILQKVLLKKPGDSNGWYCTTVVEELSDCTYYIITVPTPVDNLRKNARTKI